MIFFMFEYRYDFGLEEDEEDGCFILDVSCPRYEDIIHTHQGIGIEILELE